VGGKAYELVFGGISRRNHRATRVHEQIPDCHGGAGIAANPRLIADRIGVGVEETEDGDTSTNLLRSSRLGKPSARQPPASVEGGSDQLAAAALIPLGHLKVRLFACDQTGFGTAKRKMETPSLRSCRGDRNIEVAEKYPPW